MKDEDQLNVGPRVIDPLKVKHKEVIEKATSILNDVLKTKPSNKETIQALYNLYMETTDMNSPVALALAAYLMYRLDQASENGAKKAIGELKSTLEVYI